MRLFHIFSVTSAIVQVTTKAGKAYKRDEGHIKHAMQLISQGKIKLYVESNVAEHV